MSVLIKKALTLFVTSAVLACSQSDLSRSPMVDSGSESPDMRTTDLGDLDLDTEQGDLDVDQFSVDWSDADMDMEDLPKQSCVCADPLATCHPTTGSCVRMDVDCTATSCPDGYECTTPQNGAPYCRCDGTYDECGPFCDQDQLCPGNRLLCDDNPLGGVCRQNIPCADDFECGPGKICERLPQLDQDVCLRTGGKADGEPCVERSECDSRRCIGGVCTPLCFVNSDCGDGEVCIFGSGLVPDDSNGCVPGSCEIAECDETQQRCFPPSQRCDPPACLVSGDCEGADCILELGVNRGGECSVPEMGETPACKPGEFRAYDGDPYCRLPDPCWHSSICQAEFGEECDDCPALYDCLFPDPNFSPRSWNSFCSRLVE